MSRLQYEIFNDHVIGHFDNGKQMLFDVADLPLVSSLSWFIDTCGYPSTNYEGRTVRLHRLLFKEIPDGLVVDHMNRSKLDNRRTNLRICSQQKNMQNMSLKSNNTSGVAGVFFDKQVQRWRAQISNNGKTKYIGIFDNFDDAVKARKDAEKLYYA